MNLLYKQTGFTLIELVLTIVLLGILAATAVPRFADLGEAADSANFDAIRSNFKTGVYLVYSTSLLKKPKASGGIFPDVSLEGTCIQVDPASGYPLVDQTTGTCNPVASYHSVPFPASPMQQELLLALISKRFLSVFVPSAFAGGGPPPPPPESDISSELPALLMDGDFSGWIWNKTAPTATLLSPAGDSFTYNQETGLVQ